MSSRFILGNTEGVGVQSLFCVLSQGNEAGSHRTGWWPAVVWMLVCLTVSGSFPWTTAAREKLRPERKSGWLGGSQCTGCSIRSLPLGVLGDGVSRLEESRCGGAAGFLAQSLMSGEICIDVILPPSISVERGQLCITRTAVCLSGLHSSFFYLKSLRLLSPGTIQSVVIMPPLLVTLGSDFLGHLRVLPDPRVRPFLPLLGHPPYLTLFSLRTLTWLCSS